MKLDLDTQVFGNPELLHARAGQELMMMDLESGNYFGLDSIGARIWELVAQPIKIRDICARLVAEYDVDPEACKTDVLGFLEKLAKNGIVKVAPG